MRIVITGNSGGGKSVLARRIAPALGLPCTEVDSILWRPGWQLAPPEVYDSEHARLVAQDRWVLEGLGSRASLPPRFQRATHIVLIDMPLWVHFWLAAERHVAWLGGQLEHPPAGSAKPAPLKALFATIDEIDREWMPQMRRLVADEEKSGKQVFRLATFEDVISFRPSVLESQQ
jgi:hypothetical protein